MFDQYDSSRFSGIKTADDLFSWLNWSKISLIASWLLAYWCLTPVFVLIYRHFLPTGDAMAEVLKVLSIITFWRVFLLQTGLLGLILFTAAVAKRIRQITLVRESLMEILLKHLPLLLLFALLVWSLLSALAASDPTKAFIGTVFRREGWLTYLMYGGLFCLGLLIQEKKHLAKVIDLLIAASLLLAAIDLLGSLSVFGFFGIEAKTSVFFNINHSGYFFCLTLLLAVGRFLQSKDCRLIRIIRYAGCLVLTAVLVLNTSFGPFLAACFGMLLIALLPAIGYRGLWFQIVLVLVGFVAVSILANLVTAHLGTDIALLTDDVSDILENSDQAVAAGTDRWFLWINAIIFIGEKPLLGYGPDNLGVRYNLAGTYKDRPHNELLQIASSLGLPALVFYLGTLVLIAWRVIRQVRQIGLTAIVLFIAAAGYFVSSLFGNSMFYTTPFFFMVLGMLARQVIPRRT